MRENGKDDSRYGKDYRPETLMDAIGEVDDKLLAEADAWRSERMARAEAAEGRGKQADPRRGAPAAGDRSPPGTGTRCRC